VQRRRLEGGTHICVRLSINCRDAAQDITLVVSWRLILVVTAVAHTKGVASVGETLVSRTVCVGGCWR
jgi:hypothetical protein